MIDSPTVCELEVDGSVSDAVVRALADSKDTDPLDLDVRLYDVIDPDALDAMFQSGQATDRRISFSVADRRVVVESDRVRVTPERSIVEAIDAVTAQS
jgi:hypothetical protein